MKIGKYIIPKKVAIVIVAFFVSLPIAFYGGKKVGQYITKLNVQEHTQAQIKEDFQEQTKDEKIEKSKDPKGAIDTNVEFADYEVDSGFEETKNKTYTNQNISEVNKNNLSGSSGNSTSKPNYVSSEVNKSSLSGNNITIVEGNPFNPLIDLQLKAIDKDGTNITNKIKIKENNVNEYKPGIYTVKAFVILNDNSSIEKIFNVNVTKAPITYNLYDFKSRDEYVSKGSEFTVDLSIDFSDRNVTPTFAEVNGKKYNIFKNMNIFSNRIDYFIYLNAGNSIGDEFFRLEKLHLSDGTILDMDAVFNIKVLKSNPTIKDIDYEELDTKGNIKVKFNLDDIDDTVSNMKVALYEYWNNPISEYEIDKTGPHEVDFKVDSNGKYKLKIFADVNRTPDKDSTEKEKVLYSEDITISKIDKSDIIGNNNIEIYEGSSFDLYKDLNLKAIDVDGEDITKNISIEKNDVDTTIVGTYNVILSVINKNGDKIERTFIVNVKPVVAKDGEDFIRSRNIIEVEGKSHIDDSYLKTYSTSNRNIRNKVSGSDTSELTTTVPIEGIIKGNDGSLPAGRIEVELPTSMAFTVDKDGNFNAATTYNINNKSDVDIEVFLMSFTETQPNGGITVKKDDIKQSDNRGTVNLDIQGNRGNARLYHKDNLNTKLSEIGPQSISSLVLTGSAGKGNEPTIDNNGVAEDFTMTFKIRKKV